MKKVIATVGAALIAATAFAGAASAQSYRDYRYDRHHGRAYGHVPFRGHYRGYGYGVPPYAYRYDHRRNRNAALAAGVTGAIVGGALAAQSQNRGYDGYDNRNTLSRHYRGGPY